MDVAPLFIEDGVVRILQKKTKQNKFFFFLKFESVTGGLQPVCIKTVFPTLLWKMCILENTQACS